LHCSGPVAWSPLSDQGKRQTLQFTRGSSSQEAEREKKNESHVQFNGAKKCLHYFSLEGKRVWRMFLYRNRTHMSQYRPILVILSTPLSPWRRPAPAPPSVCEASIPVITQPLPPSRTAIQIIFYSNLRHDNNKKCVGSLKGNQAPDFVCTLVVCLCGCEVCGGVGSVWGCCNVWCTCVSLSN